MRVDAAANRRRAALVCFAFAIPPLAVGALLSPVLGVWILVVAGVLVVAGLWAALAGSERIALAAAGAVHASPEAYPRYHNLVEGLCTDLRMPKPALYVIDEEALNAMAPPNKFSQEVFDSNSLRMLGQGQTATTAVVRNLNKSNLTHRPRQRLGFNFWY